MLATDDLLPKCTSHLRTVHEGQMLKNNFLLAGFVLFFSTGLLNVLFLKIKLNHLVKQFEIFWTYNLNSTINN